MNLLEIRNLVKIYDNGSEELKILDRIDLELEKGGNLVITGESGCGKSTLLNIIGSLDTAQSGTVRVGNYNVSELDEDELYRYRNSVVGFIFQFHYLLKELTAVENVMLPSFISGTPRKKALEKAEYLLERVNLINRKDHYSRQLSGGERQRVAVARAMINDPELILADEPTGNLDSDNSEIVENLLFRLVEENNTTLVLVTHDAAIAKRGEKKITIEKGKLLSI